MGAKLRPWNVFKKTLFASRADAGAGRLSVATRLSLARQRLNTEEEDENPSSTFTRNLAVILPVSAAAWLTLMGLRWRYSDPERMRRAEQSAGGVVLLDILGSRLVSHFGPYQVPNFVAARMYEAPMQSLNEELLLDHERSQAIGRLAQITQRQAAVLEMTRPQEGAVDCSRGRMMVLEPLLHQAFARDAHGTLGRLSSTETMQTSAARIVFDIVAALPADDRAVPDWVLQGLVKAKCSPWKDGPQGEELRAELLRALLRNAANCELAAQLPDVIDYVQQRGIRIKADTLFPVRAYLLSGETPDLLRRCARQIAKQKPDAVEVPPAYPRDTPALQTKIDVRNVWTTFLITTAYACFRAWRGVLDLKALGAMARASAGAVGGITVLEALWRAEDCAIDTEWYYQGGPETIGASAGMALVNSAALAWAVRYPVLVPFVANRLVKDDFLDAYRTVAP